MVVDILWLGIALLLAPALAEIAKIKQKKGFMWIAAGGVLYLLAAAFAFEVPNLGVGASLVWGTVLFSVIGLIAVLIGALTVLMGTFK